MTFLIADTFTDSPARLTADEQKATTTAFDLQMDPSSARDRLSISGVDPASEFLDEVRG
jgi:hypothetical protein